MTAPTTPDVALPEAVRGALVNVLNATIALADDGAPVSAAPSPLEREHEAALATLRAAIVAYGRECAAEALAEVDAGIVARLGGDKHIAVGSYGPFGKWHAPHENGWWASGGPYDRHYPTPTAAILAAAAALEEQTP